MCIVVSLSLSLSLFLSLSLSHSLSLSLALSLSLSPGALLHLWMYILQLLLDVLGHLITSTARIRREIRGRLQRLAVVLGDLFANLDKTQSGRLNARLSAPGSQPPPCNPTSQPHLATPLPNRTSQPRFQTPLPNPTSHTAGRAAWLREERRTEWQKGVKGIARSLTLSDSRTICASWARCGGARGAGAEKATRAEVSASADRLISRVLGSRRKSAQRAIRGFISISNRVTIVRRVFVLCQCACLISPAP